jgi:hypothetical protein
VETYIDNPHSGQAFPAPNLSENHHADLIEQYRASERGDHRAIAALLTIERECAEIDQEATSVDPIPTPAAAANTVDDRSVDLCAISREIAAYRKLTGQPHAVPPQYRASRRARRRSIPPKARRVAPAKPNIRPARARAVQSHASHGGARKRDDCDSGGGDSPPGTASPNLSPGDLAGCTGSMTDDPRCYTGVVFYDGKPFARVEGDNPDIGRYRVIVDGDRVVAYDEFDVGVLRGHDLSYSFRPDRAVHHADALHLEHEVVLRQAWVLCAQPVEPFGRPDFLGVEILEEHFKVTMPFANTFASRSAPGFFCLNRL